MAGREGKGGCVVFRRGPGLEEAFRYLLLLLSTRPRFAISDTSGWLGLVAASSSFAATISGLCV